MNLPFITFICDSSFCFLGTDCDLKKDCFQKRITSMILTKILML